MLIRPIVIPFGVGGIDIDSLTRKIKDESFEKLIVYSDCSIPEAVFQILNSTVLFEKVFSWQKKWKTSNFQRLISSSSVFCQREGFFSKIIPFIKLDQSLSGSSKSNLLLASLNSQLWFFFANYQYQIIFILELLPLLHLCRHLWLPSYNRS